MPDSIPKGPIFEITHFPKLPFPRWPIFRSRSFPNGLIPNVCKRDWFMNTFSKWPFPLLTHFRSVKFSKWSISVWTTPRTLISIVSHFRSYSFPNLLISEAAHCRNDQFLELAFFGTDSFSKWSIFGGVSFPKSLINEVIDFEVTHFRSGSFFNPQAPVAQKLADEVVFRRFQGEGVEFFKIGPHWPPSDFWCASFGKD